MVYWKIEKGPNDEMLYKSSLCACVSMLLLDAALEQSIP